MTATRWQTLLERGRAIGRRETVVADWRRPGRDRETTEGGHRKTRLDSSVTACG